MTQLTVQKNGTVSTAHSRVAVGGWRWAGPVASTRWRPASISQKAAGGSFTATFLWDEDKLVKVSRVRLMAQQIVAHVAAATGVSPTAIPRGCSSFKRGIISVVMEREEAVSLVQDAH